MIAVHGRWEPGGLVMGVSVLVVPCTETLGRQRNGQESLEMVQRDWEVR
jgi:hypothetical protein